LQSGIGPFFVMLDVIFIAMVRVRVVLLMVQRRKGLDLAGFFGVGFYVTARDLFLILNKSLGRDTG